MIQESESDVDDVETIPPNKNRNRILPPKPAQINTWVTTNQRKRKFTDGKSTTQPNKRKRTVKHRIVCGENDQSKPPMSQMSPIRVPYDPQPVRKRMQATRHFPCRDYYGNNCLFDHGLNPIVVKDSELDYFKASSIFNPNPPPPGLEEKPQQRQDVYLHSQQITSAAALVQPHCTALLTVGGTAQTTLPNHAMSVPYRLPNPYDRFPLDYAWLQEMEAQNERLKSEAERNTARLGLVQLCRLTKDLYEKSVEQQKLLLLKLQKLNNDKMKRQQAKALIKKSEDMAKKAKCELEEMFRRLT